MAERLDPMSITPESIQQMHPNDQRNVQSTQLERRLAQAEGKHTQLQTRYENNRKLFLAALALERGTLDSNDPQFRTLQMIMQRNGQTAQQVKEAINKAEGLEERNRLSAEKQLRLTEVQLAQAEALDPLIQDVPVATWESLAMTMQSAIDHGAEQRPMNARRLGSVDAAVLIPRLKERGLNERKILALAKRQIERLQGYPSYYEAENAIVNYDSTALQEQHNRDQQELANQRALLQAHNAEAAITEPNLPPTRVRPVTTDPNRKWPSQPLSQTQSNKPHEQLSPKVEVRPQTIRKQLNLEQPLYQRGEVGAWTVANTRRVVRAIIAELNIIAGYPLLDPDKLSVMPTTMKEAGDQAVAWISTAPSVRDQAAGFRRRVLSGNQDLMIQKQAMFQGFDVEQAIQVQVPMEIADDFTPDQLKTDPSVLNAIKLQLMKYYNFSPQQIAQVRQLRLEI